MEPKEWSALAAGSGEWPAWPGTHPMTGERFVAFDIERRQDLTRVCKLPPVAPMRVVTEYDDLGEECGERTLTEEEFAEAEAAYTRAMAEWQKTRGIHFVRGPSSTECTFRTASGAAACGLWTGTEWRWLDVRT